MKYCTIIFIALLVLGSKCQQTQTILDNMQDNLANFMSGIAATINPDIQHQVQQFRWKDVKSPVLGIWQRLLIMIQSIIHKLHTQSFSFAALVETFWEFIEICKSIPVIQKILDGGFKCMKHSLSYYAIFQLVMNFTYNYSDYSVFLDEIQYAFMTNNYTKAGQVFVNLVKQLSPTNSEDIIMLVLCSFL